RGITDYLYRIALFDRLRRRTGGSLASLGDSAANGPVSRRSHQTNRLPQQKTIGNNFATVFSIFDRAFGRITSPDPAPARSGSVTTSGAASEQFMYPFVCWFNDLRPRGNQTHIDFST